MRYYPTCRDHALLLPVPAEASWESGKGRFAGTGPTLSCKLLDLRATRHAICTPRLAEKAHVQTSDIHNTLNGDVPEEQNLAAQFQLCQSTWNASIRQPS